MPDRCLSFRDDDEVRRLLAGASVVVRPVQWPDISSRDNVNFRGVFQDEVGWWVDWYVPRIGGTFLDPPGTGHGPRTYIKPPLAPGDILVGREAWRVMIALYIEYRADGAHRQLRGDEVFWPFRPWDSSWRTPQTMLAALARIRRRVGSVEAVEIGEVTNADWFDAGFKGSEIATPTEQALAWWVTRYGPDSWSGWVWVFSGLEEVSGE